MSRVSLETDCRLNTLPTPIELHSEIPITESQSLFIKKSREAIEAILNGWDPRILLILGPCSIHDLAAAREYGALFKEISDELSDRFFLVMRTYFEKPRTILGWKGFLYDPDIDGSYNLAKGIRHARKLLSDLTDLKIPVGCELLEINTASFYSDYLSWGCVGARTSSSPPHRQLAAGLKMPIGFKNSLDGNIDHAIHGILSAASPHVYLGMSPYGTMTRIEAAGNAACHVVLRGSIRGPNYYSESVDRVIQKCREAAIVESIVIDCSHDNCSKNPMQQMSVFQNVVQQILQGNKKIVGMMLESHLFGGTQKISPHLQYGVSITDPCLDWMTTKKMLLSAYHDVNQQAYCFV